MKCRKSNQLKKKEREKERQKKKKLAFIIMTSKKCNIYIQVQVIKN